ncbi:MAG: hypothetical protein V1672_04805 [Candidatus Diapherotrites archaeon]
MRAIFIVLGILLMAYSTQAYECSNIQIDVTDFELDAGTTEYKVFELWNVSGSDFYIEYAEVYDYSSDFRAENVRYDSFIEAHGFAEIKVKVKANEIAEDAKGTGYVIIRGFFADEKRCYTDELRNEFEVSVSGNPRFAIQEYIENEEFKVRIPEYFLGKLNEEVKMPIEIYNKTNERVEISFMGQDAKVTPQNISVPRNSVIKTDLTVILYSTQAEISYSNTFFGSGNTILFAEREEIAVPSVPDVQIIEEIEENGAEEAQEVPAEKSEDVDLISEAFNTGFATLSSGYGMILIILVAFAALLYLLFSDRKEQSLI